MTSVVVVVVVVVANLSVSFVNTDNVGLVVGVSFLIFVILVFICVTFVYAYRHNEKFKRFWLRSHSDKYMYAPSLFITLCLKKRDPDIIDCNFGKD